MDSVGGEAGNREKSKFSHVVGAEVKTIFKKVFWRRAKREGFWAI
jgi:hypothetical protein